MSKSARVVVLIPSVGDWRLLKEHLALAFLPRSPPTPASLRVPFVTKAGEVMTKVLELIQADVSVENQHEPVVFLFAQNPPNITFRDSLEGENNYKCSYSRYWIALIAAYAQQTDRPLNAVASFICSLSRMPKTYPTRLIKNDLQLAKVLLCFRELKLRDEIAGAAVSKQSGQVNILFRALAKEIKLVYPEEHWSSVVFHCFTELPTELQQVILDYATPTFRELVPLTEVCKAWGSVWASKQHLNFSRYVNARNLSNDTFTNILAHCGLRLRSLTITNCASVSDAAFSQLVCCTNLTALDISRCRFLESSLLILSSFVHLKTLAIADCQGFAEIGLTLSSFSFLAPLKKLESLDLSYSYFDFYDTHVASLFGSIAMMKALRVLKVDERGIHHPLWHRREPGAPNCFEIVVLPHIWHLPLEKVVLNRTEMTYKWRDEILLLYPECKWKLW